MYMQTDLRYTGIIQVDKEKLKRVFFNLASNARDAMLEGGELTIISECIGDFVLFSFKDTGSGISRELQKRIFDPFVSEGKAHGTGLGMAIVKKIVDEHQGTIEIESEVGRGTTITIKLPRKQACLTDNQP
jgi:signal transduction histidine kinase